MNCTQPLLSTLLQAPCVSRAEEAKPEAGEAKPAAGVKHSAHHDEVVEEPKSK